MLPKYQKVSYELLRPEEIRAMREQCPVAYIVAGALEWHSFHLPMGTDGIKAHAVCCEAALRHGGVVLPPFHLGLLGDGNWGPEAWDGYTLGYNHPDMFEAAMLGVVRALVAAQWKIIVGVTGHDVAVQRDAMQRAIERGTNGTAASGFALKEGEPHGNPHPNVPMPQITAETWATMQSQIEVDDPEIPLVMDHAAAYETSCIMHAQPDAVDLDALRSRELSSDEVFDQSEAEGMMGKSPLKYASAAVGRRIVERMGDVIGGRASALLAALDEERG